ncbi:neurexin-4-like [Dendronephthya gigantea]|uniref:neurexin-4-like n=1 Tax=Dendronephthya gigantea TaxID=151771 RepID=UPI00106BFF6A|nr:neurexin-4-like [Dendronephthya gigantea]
MFSNVLWRILIFLACMITMSTTTSLPKSDKVNKLQKRVRSLATVIGNQQSSIQSLESKTESQRKTIQTQESLAQNRSRIIQNQANVIEMLENEYQDILDLVQSSHSATCSMLKQEFPLTPNGMYKRNPLSPSKPVKVYCDMTSRNGVGVTVIGHDSEIIAHVKGYEAAGSYRRNITYDIPMEQIAGIINKSANCEQFIKYECFRSGLLKNSDGWWVSRQGSKMNYWGGAAVDSGRCACGMTNSCAGRKGCNCDKNDNEWREDSGNLTDKKTLPVTQLRFGDTGDTVPEKRRKESGYHTLGKLLCWG